MADLSDITIGINVEDGDVVRGIKTFERMKRQVADLTLAERKGEITRKAYNRSLQQMGNQLGKVTGNTNNAKSAVQKYAFAVKDATDEQLKFQSVSGKGMRRLELIAQQAGFQIGDLAVQIQSGTNAAVALGQQGSQLLGFFGPMGALAGAGLAITTGLVAPFLNAKEEVKGLQEELKNLEDFINSVGQATTIEGLKSRELAEAAENLAAAQAKLRDLESGQALPQAQSSSGKMFAAARIAEATEAVAAAEEELEIIERKIRQQEVYNALKGSEIQEVKNLRDAEEERIRRTNSAEQEYQERLARTRRLMGQLRQEQRQKEAAEAKEYEERLSRTRRIMGKIKQERREEAAERKRIAESTENTDKLRYEIELRRAKLLADFYERKRERAREADQEALRAQELLASATESAISSQLSQQDNLQVELAEVKAAIEAVKNGQDASVASFVAGELAKAEAAYETSKALALQSGNLIALAEAALIFVDVEDKLKKLADLKGALKDIRDREGGSSTVKRDSNLERLQKQLALEGRLIGKTEAQRRVIQALGDDYSKTKAKTIQGLITQIEEQDKLNKKIAQQEQIANTVANGFTDAFMSIADGTKTVEGAFKDMARLVIAELYKILVVQQLVGSIMGAFGYTQSPSGTYVKQNANGNAFSKGSITPFADGGVVGSPTFFPMTGGRTGLMGEAGPEAIMPLKRGKDGKLGVQAEGSGQQPVVINQHFNFSANGDESVKKIIAQQAPKIAQMTQQQILDQRRRGGQMKAAFS